MTDTSQRRSPGGLTAESPRASTQKTPGSGRPGDRGRTTISDSVVQKIAGTVAREVPGVHGLGSGMARTFGAVRERTPGAGSPSATQGVKAEVGEVQAALDLEIVVEYGFPIMDLANEVRGKVISEVERMTGLEVVEVNIAVTDVEIPEGEGAAARIR